MALSVAQQVGIASDVRRAAAELREVVRCCDRLDEVAGYGADAAALIEALFPAASRNSLRALATALRTALLANAQAAVGGTLEDLAGTKTPVGASIVEALEEDG